MSAGVRVLVLVAAAGASCGGAAPSNAVDGGSVVVAMTELIGTVPECDPGSAHPNVCCRGGACVAHPGAPFLACAAEALTFPDRRRCCALGAPTDCVDVPTTDGGADGGVFRECSLPCGPEGHPTEGLPLSTCTNGTVSSDCSYCCSGLSCAGSLCHCPNPEGVCQCDTPSCAACPSGWAAVVPQVDLCCRAGAHECFSQSVEVRAPVEGRSSQGGPDRCEIYDVENGHIYDVLCDVKATPECACSLDGTTTMTFALPQGDCSFEMCGFAP